MVQSDASTVDGYVAALDATWRPTIEHLRERCRSTLSSCDEVMAYGMPTYQQGDKVAIGFALQRRHLSLYVAKKGVLDAQRSKLAGLSLGKGCVRFARPDQVDFEVIDVLLTESERSIETPC